MQDKFSDKFGIGDDNAPAGPVEMAVITATTPGLPPEGDSARVMRVVDAVNSTKYTGGVKKLQKALVKKVLFRIYPFICNTTVYSFFFFYYVLIGFLIS